MGWGRYALGYSVSRWHVDRFWRLHQGLFRCGRVLDVGGSKRRPFGLFDRALAEWWGNVEVVNPDPAEAADHVCRLEDLSGVEPYDVIRMSEVLEHSAQPEAVLAAAWKLLTPEGHLLGTVPFFYRIHAADDYGRWTAQRVMHDLDRAGFTIEAIWALGGWPSVLVDLVKQGAAVLLPRWLHGAATLCLVPAQWALAVEGRFDPTESNLFLWTTGWGFHARKH